VNGHVYPEVDNHRIGPATGPKPLRSAPANGMFESIGEPIARRSKKLGPRRGVGDFDNDGDLEIRINNIDVRPRCCA